MYSYLFFFFSFFLNFTNNGFFSRRKDIDFFEISDNNLIGVTIIQIMAKYCFEVMNRSLMVGVHRSNQRYVLIADKILSSLL